MISEMFPAYTAFNPLIPVWCTTPNEGHYTHRFFDTSPISPSGRYLAVLNMPQENRLPEPGEAAQVILIDLHTAEEKVVAETIGWEIQLGANLNWGADDDSLYFNNVNPETWVPYIVELNPHTGAERQLEGSIYRISPDGKSIISACAKRMRRTQYGYGVMVPDAFVPRNQGISKDDGLYMTDVVTGVRKLLVSIHDVFKKILTADQMKQYEQRDCYGFHCKYNPQGTRLLFTIRSFQTDELQPWHKLDKDMHFFVVTMKPDGSGIHLAVGPEEWIKGGHHINWFPDGEHLSMNLKIDSDENLYFVQARYDGTDLRKIDNNIPGSGHPSIHPNGRYILTDTYEREAAAFGDGTVPIRLIDLHSQNEMTLVRINVHNPEVVPYSPLRIDPHPVWSPDFRFIVFNAFVNGARRVFVADISR